MRKIFSALLAISFLAVMMTPMLALAQATQCTLKHTITGFTNCAVTNVVCDIGGGCAFPMSEWGMCCILDALYTATDWIFIILIIFVGLLIIWGGFSIATAGGSPEKVQAGRNFILYALIGLAVALLSKALPSVVKALLGV